MAQTWKQAPRTPIIRRLGVAIVVASQVSIACHGTPHEPDAVRPGAGAVDAPGPVTKDGVTVAPVMRVEPQGAAFPTRGGFGPLAADELGFISATKPGDGFHVWSQSRGLVASVDGLGPVDSLLVQSGPADAVLAWKWKGSLTANRWNSSTLAFEAVTLDATPPVLDISPMGGEAQSPGFVVATDTASSGKETIMTFTYVDGGPAPSYQATSITFDISGVDALVAAFAQTPPPAATGGPFTVVAMLDNEVRLVDENGATIATSGYNSLERLAKQLVCRSRAPAPGVLCIVNENSALESFAWDGGNSLGPIHNLKDSSAGAEVTPTLALSLDVDRLQDGRFIALLDDENSALNLDLPDSTAYVLLRVTDGEGQFTAAANLQVDGTICTQGIPGESSITPEHPVWERGSSPPSFVMTCPRSKVTDLSDTLIRVTPDLSALMPL